MDLVSALMVLQTADEEELQFHGIQTILTLRQVGQRLQAHILPDGNELSIGESEVEGNFSTSADFSSSGSSRHSSPVTSTNKDASNEGPRNGYLGGHQPFVQESKLGKAFAAIYRQYHQKDEKILLESRNSAQRYHEKGTVALVDERR